MSELFLLKNSEVIDLFEVKINDFEGYFRFHGSKNFNKDVVFQGQSYIYIPSEISNLEYSSDAKQNRPTLIISNINNFITNFIKDRNDLLGKRFYRKKILAKDLDDVNFGGANRNTLGGGAFKSFIASDTYIIHRKNYETKEKVEFSLANILDLEGITIPARKVYNDFCSWQYRGCGCNYGKIYGYNGPSVETNYAPYTSLTEINTEDPNNNLSANLVVWLKPEGITTSGTIEIQELGVLSPNVAKTLSFKKVTSWTNQGTAASLVQPDFLSTEPKLYENNGRLNNQKGVYFSVFINGYVNPGSGTNDTPDKMIINRSYTGEDVTIFYVSELVNVRYKSNQLNGGEAEHCVSGGVVRRGLTTSYPSSPGGNNFALGYWAAERGNTNKYKDVCFINTSWISQVNGACQILNTPQLYGCSLPKTAGNNTKMIVNGNIYNKGTNFTGQPGYLGINTFASETSEIVVYELIVYNKLLSDEEINKVNSYLSSKYNISIPKTATRTIYKKSSDYFKPQDGNLGIPVADENNKIFLKSYAESSFRLSNFESYNILSMEYKTGYNPDYAYKQGDFIKIDPYIEYDFNEKSINQNNELPTRFFVCIDPQGSKGKHPLNYTNVWAEDKCSRNLNGCSLRFNDPTVNIPFGGFPGTVGYDYKLPSS